MLKIALLATASGSAWLLGLGAWTMHEHGGLGCHRGRGAKSEIVQRFVQFAVNEKLDASTRRRSSGRRSGDQGPPAARGPALTRPRRACTTRCSGGAGAGPPDAARARRSSTSVQELWSLRGRRHGRAAGAPPHVHARAAGEAAGGRARAHGAPPPLGPGL